MNDWGVIAYDDDKKRWQWWSRYVSEVDARAGFTRRVLEMADSLLVRMTTPQPAVHRCGPDCACIREVVRFAPTPLPRNLNPVE